jgi:hypothetical protein
MGGGEMKAFDFREGVRVDISLKTGNLGASYTIRVGPGYHC